MNITENNAVARQKLEENIAEFIIYMYQMEDLIRVYEFNLDDIRQYVISHFPVEDDEKQEMETWFSNIMENMKEQGLTDRGHLREVQEFVDQLLRLKEELLPADEEFAAVYNAARPHIRESIRDSHGAVKSDIQACLNGIYGLLLCRMGNKEVPEELQEGLEHFGNVLSYLSFRYRQVRFQGDN